MVVQISRVFLIRHNIISGELRLFLFENSKYKTFKLLKIYYFCEKITTKSFKLSLFQKQNNLLL